LLEQARQSEVRRASTTSSRRSKPIPPTRGLRRARDAYNILADIGTVAPLEARARARAATSRALDLDPRLAEAHTSRAFIRFFFDWDWDGAERAFKEAIALNPNYATAHQWYRDCWLRRAASRRAVGGGHGGPRRSTRCRS
jgi:tetratricopeptide (TPR) repeat protein